MNNQPLFWETAALAAIHVLVLMVQAREWNPYRSGWRWGLVPGPCVLVIGIGWTASLPAVLWHWMPVVLSMSLLINAHLDVLMLLRDWFHASRQGQTLRTYLAAQGITPPVAEPATPPESEEPQPRHIEPLPPEKSQIKLKAPPPRQEVEKTKPGAADGSAVVALGMVWIAVLLTGSEWAPVALRYLAVDEVIVQLPWVNGLTAVTLVLQFCVTAAVLVMRMAQFGVAGVVAPLWRRRTAVADAGSDEAGDDEGCDQDWSAYDVTDLAEPQRHRSNGH